MRTALAALVLLALQDAKPLFEDRFEGKLADGWTWLREDAAGRRIEKGVLKIRTAPGSLWEKSNDAKNVLLRKLPAAGIGRSVGIEVDLVFSPRSPAEQAGLLLRVSDDFYAKLIVQSGENGSQVLFAIEVEGAGSPVGAVDLKAKSVRLRLSWEGSKVIAETRPEGAADWAIMSYCESPFKGEKVDLTGGLVAHGGAADGDRWAEFRSFKVHWLE